MESRMSKNNSGGSCFVVDNWTRARRFFCLGTEGGSYYCTQAKLERQSCKAIEALVMNDEDGLKLVELITEYSLEGRTAKQDPLIFALAMAATLGSLEVRKAAYMAVGKVCRIPTTLFMFMEFVKACSPGNKGKWGRMPRTALKHWYLDMDSKKLAYQCTKFRNRNGWTHKDLLRCCHPKTSAEDMGRTILFAYLVKGKEAFVEYEKDLETLPADAQQMFTYLKAVEAAGGDTPIETVCELIQEHGLAWEHVNNTLLSSPQIWGCLLKSMPMGAMLRNLAKMTAINLLSHGNEMEAFVCESLRSETKVQNARLHPFNILVARKVYQRGSGVKGSLTWSPCPEIAAALEDAYYNSFKYIEPTGKRIMIALDVSGSMTCNRVIGSELLMASEAAACLCMAVARAESNYQILAFSNVLVPLNIDGLPLEEVQRRASSISMGSTDCSLPMKHALDHNLLFDAFVVVTDNETNCNRQPPATVLREYRNRMNPQAKLIVIAMSVSKFSIADPSDAGMMDVAGFDSAAPRIISEFIGDKI